jgi:Rrf2 family iron-sulfur cluster assembly transcriptional regulator
MWLNSTAQNALRAVLFIAGNEADGPVRVDLIAASLQSPRNYLSKTLHILARSGVLRSSRGPKGGFQLASPAEHMPLARVVGPFAPAGERRCLVGRATCGDAHPCLVHHRWSRVAKSVEDFFSKTTVADLLKPGAGEAVTPSHASPHFRRSRGAYYGVARSPD